jgi:phosphatidylglycerophosphate synthase
MLLAFTLAHTHWQWSVLCYLGAFTGDLFDGMAARYFNQCE